MSSLDNQASGLATWAMVARTKAVRGKQGYEPAVDWMASNRLSEQVRQICKTAIGASGSLGQIISIGAWTDSARTRSCFYRILGDGGFTRLPWHTRVGLATSSPSAGVVPEGKAIVVSKEIVGNVLLSPIKVGAIVVATDTLWFDLGAAGQQMFNRELLGAVSDAVDLAFVNDIGTGVTPIASTSALADLRAAMAAVNFVGQARPYWLAHPGVGALASTLSSAKGGPAFAAASVVGGELANLPLLISSGVPNGQLYFIDASGIAANGETPSVDISSEADIEMNTTPTSASDVPTMSTMTSLYGTDSTALRSIAYLAAVRLRANAVSVVTGITSTTWAAT